MVAARNGDEKMTEDEMVELLSQRSESSSVLPVLEGYVKRREAALLNALLSKYETATSEQIRGMVGGIAALRGLLRDVERDLAVAKRETAERPELAVKGE